MTRETLRECRKNSKVIARLRERIERLWSNAEGGKQGFSTAYSHANPGSEKIPVQVGVIMELEKECLRKTEEYADVRGEVELWVLSLPKRLGEVAKLWVLDGAELRAMALEMVITEGSCRKHIARIYERCL